jgi:hypothetical protein
MKVGRTIDCLIDGCGGPMVDKLVVEENGMTVTGGHGRIGLCESLKVRRSSTG